jgi:hypothetical protein
MTRPRYYIAHLFWFTALFLSVFSGPATASQTTGPGSKQKRSLWVSSLGHPRKRSKRIFKTSSVT